MLTPKIFIFFLCLLLALSMVLKQGEQKPSGDQKLTIYLIPHSHDDVGWLKTPDNYFYGGDQQTQWAGVQYTLDSVITELSVNANLKFSIVEIAFLDMWWRSANQTMKNLMTDFVKANRIEFLNAGWCMSDEATVYYQDAIDQMSLGLRWIKEKFNVVPKVAWQIDPFGHQASFATLGHQLGFNSLFFGRVHYEDKINRENKKAMEVVWKPPQISGIQDGLLAHINYFGYNAPPGFCYDRVCMDEPIKTDPTLEGYNVDVKAQAFVDYFKNMSKYYRSTNLMHTLGSDFQWSNARLWTLNIDKLMKYINNKSQFGVTVKYATPSEYVDAIYKQNIQYPVKTDDFFPYADYTDAYWSGYFTSRVAVKGFVRDTGRWLQAVRTKLAFLKLSNQSAYLNSHLNESEAAIMNLEKQMGVLQHHDAVSGTEKQRVAEQYIRVASKAKAGLIDFYTNIIKEQTSNIVGEAPDQIFQTNWNQTYNEWGISKSLSANKNVLLHLYNPGPEGEYSIKVKVSPRNMSIQGATGSAIKGDIVCGNTKDAQDCQLFFNVNIPQTSWGFVKLAPTSSAGSATIVPISELTVLSPTKQIKLSSTASVKIHRNDEKFDLTLPSGNQSFSLAYNYYQSFQDGGQKSGAYIFRPSPATKNSSKKYSTLKSLHYSDGNNVLVVSLVEDKTYTKIYFSKTSGYVESFGVEIETFVDSISITDNQGKQIVLDITTGINNDKTFYTDSNGLEEQKRVLDTMPTWNITVHQPVAGNYYPLNSHIKIKDSSNKTVSVVVDRARGGSVLKSGVIELMLHRRTLHDDGRGVDEPLNESDSSGKGLTQILRNYLVFGNNNRALQKRLDQNIQITWSNSITNTFQKYQPKSVVMSVPKEVKLWLRYMPDDSYLLRLQLLDTTISSSNVEIPDGLKTTELTLGTNQALDDWKQNQYKWKSSESEHSVRLRATKGEDVQQLRSPQQNTITLKALEMRTFKLTK